MHDKHLLRLAVFLVRDQATAEQVVRDVLASGPAQERDVQADRRAVVNRCREINLKRRGP
jgi:hypothetical protein